VIGTSDGCQIRAASADIAIEYRMPGKFDTESLLVPITALDTFNTGGKDNITLQRQSQHRVVASWSDRDVPTHAGFSIMSKAQVKFPDVPASFVKNSPELWSALKDATASTDSFSSRYALGYLHFRGSTGQIEATNGKTLSWPSRPKLN